MQFPEASGQVNNDDRCDDRGAIRTNVDDYRGNNRVGEKSNPDEAEAR